MYLVDGALDTYLPRNMKIYLSQNLVEGTLLNIAALGAQQT
jgi:hypothetical protein